jgi:hypothetical protein
LDVTDFTTGGTSGDTGLKYVFLADICTQASGICSSTTSSATGLVGAGLSTEQQCTNCAVPGPIVGAGLPGLLAACAGLVAFARRRRLRFA